MWERYRARSKPIPLARREPQGGSQLNDADLQLRNATYQRFVEFGRAPTPSEVGRATGATAEGVIAGWRRLHDAHALVLNPRTDEIRMANPFSAVPSAYRVFVGDRWWYANCAWDAFGVCAALHRDGTIEASCPDCGEPIRVDVRAEQPDRTDLLFHCLVPAAAWWNDIIFT